MEYNFREIEKKWQQRWVEEKNLPGYGRRIEAEILCIEYVPYPSGRTARRASAGIHRFGYLRPLQTTAWLQCTQSDGI